MKPLKTWAAAAALLALAGTAQSSPVVASGSTYDAWVYGASSGLSGETVVFDGTAQTFTNGRRTVTVNESEWDLGSGAHRISFVFTANADLYTTTGENGFVNIGGNSNPLDLLMAVDLVSAEMRMFDAAGTLIGPGNFASAGTASWGGYWTGPGYLGGFVGIGGRDIRRVELDLNVAEIPEPQSAALVALALLSAGGFSRRKSRSA